MKLYQNIVLIKQNCNLELSSQAKIFIVDVKYDWKLKDVDGKHIGCDNASINDRSLQICINYCITLVQGNIIPQRRNL
jgi:hypothetical protein